MGCSMMAVSETIPDVVTGSNPVLTTIYYTQVRLRDHQKLLGFFTVHIYIKGLL